MKEIKTIDAVGHILCHDITQIIKDKTKDARFRKGHVVTEADIPVLLSLGKEHLYVWEKQTGMLHENEAAEILWEICGGENMRKSGVKEGKIDIYADCGGLFLVDKERMLKLNSMGEIMLATRHSGFAVKKGDKLAGTRVIPLVISEDKMREAKQVCGSSPLLSLIPFKMKKVGIVATGSELANGLIKDAFTPVLEEKMRESGAEILDKTVIGDNHEGITAAILSMAEKGADIVLCSGGMSVDPDDRTPLAIKNTGARVVTYGAPVLPGAMFMLAYLGGSVPVIGLPGCVMYSKRTVFDLVLPKIMADIEITAADLAVLGHGGLCLNCEVCAYPNCGFGKG